MISYKTLTAVGSATNTFNESVIGGAGGQPDWNSYLIVPGTANCTINLPRANQCEGKTIQFVSRNPNAKTITITPASGDTFILAQSTNTSISTVDLFCQVNLFCDGTSWWVIEGGSFV